MRPETSKRVKRASDIPFGVRALISSCCDLARDTHVYDDWSITTNDVVYASRQEY